MHLTRRATLALGAIALLQACGGSTTQPGEMSDLSRWEGELQYLFDDQIDPAAVGLAIDGQSPAESRALPVRAQAADVVARMRVQTVTRDSVGARTRYTLNLQVGVPTLMPSETEERSFELSIDQSSPAFGIVESLGAQLRGRTFIGFVRRFAGPEGPEIHFHLTSDTQEVAQVIQQLAMLEEVAGQ